jgi:cation diffusion facilitator family transporter
MRAIVAAAAANLAIAAMKLIAGTATGSASMLAEGVHSLVDTGNQALLFVGLRKAQKPADERHPFGYGRELYFYAFVVAVLIFTGGGVFALYEGWQRIAHPEAARGAVIGGVAIPGVLINVAVLAFAILVESGSCYVALQAFRLEKGTASSLAAIRASKDPTTFTVLIEDVAALAGLVIALAGVGLAQLLQWPALDGWASLAIGVLLIAVAGFLMAETHGLLIGEAADPALVAAVRDAVAGEAGVVHIHEVLTQHLGATDILVNISADFDDAITAAEVERIIASVEGRIRDAFPKVGRVFVKPAAGRFAPPAAATAACAPRP